jgi:hypothetical protein
MSKWTIHNDEVWVIAEKVSPNGSRVIFEFGRDRPNLQVKEVDGELGLLIFSTQEWAEKYVRDSELQDVEPVKMDHFLTWLRMLASRFPRLTCLILEPIGGYANVRTTSIAELLRNNPT